MKPPDAGSSVADESDDMGFFQVFVLLLSIYVLGVMLIQRFLAVTPEVEDLLNRIDFGVCGVFMLDFIIRFRKAKSKRAFMKWGWIDFISSIPQIDALRWGRTARIIRVIRVLRAFGSARRLIAFLYRRRMNGLAGTAIMVAVLVMMFACIAILALEDDPASNIQTPVDAVWWAFTTITTVGYGDRYPVTPEGKLVAIVVMIAGISLFGVITGLFARLFVEPEIAKEDHDIRVLIEEIRLLRSRIEHMESGSAMAAAAPAPEAGDGPPPA